MSMLSSVTTSAPQLPSRVVMYAPEKAGKSSFACHAPSPIFLMTAGETGLLSLIESGQVPPTAHFPEDFTRWDDLCDAVRSLLKEKHDFRTLVLDTGNGAEQMLAEAVCDESFDGKWSDYQDYGRGVRLAVPLWGKFLCLLDTLRTERGMSVIFLHHAAVKQTANPTGKDWDQHRPEAIDKMWGLTHKWADVICFYGTRVTVNKEDKATGEQRFLRCNPSAAIVAGNRYGLPDEITATAGAQNLWTAFASSLAKAKTKAKREPEQPNSAAPVKQLPPADAMPAQEDPAIAAGRKLLAAAQTLDQLGAAWKTLTKPVQEALRAYKDEHKAKLGDEPSGELFDNAPAPRSVPH